MNTTCSAPTAATDISLPDPTDLMAVVKHFQSPLLRYVERLMGDSQLEAEDIVQETFIRLHKQVQRKGPASIAHLPTWLFRVAHNRTLDILRKRTRQARFRGALAAPVTEVAETANEDFDALGEILRQEAQQVALRELAQLPEDQRQAVLLKVIQGLTFRQIAEVLGVSLSAVNYRLNQGLTELTRRLRHSGVM